MSLRRAIAEMDVTGVNVAAFCRDHSVSRDRFYTIRRRYEAEGEAGLAPRSRAPHAVANRTPLMVEDLIVAWRNSSPMTDSMRGRRRSSGISTLPVSRHLMCRRSGGS
jgi:hypothetical protein